MKNICAFVLLFLLTLRSYSQGASATTDSTILSFKNYLQKNIKYPAVAAENEVKGQMLITFKLNSDNKITDVQFVIPLMKECDSAVMTAIRKYHKVLSLPTGKYTIGLHYILSEEGKPDSQVIPFDKKRYKNFLFEANVKRFTMARKVEIMY